MAVTFLQAAASTTDAASYTFSSQNLGTASADRHIIVAVATRVVGATPPSISSVTVGGVAATIVVQRSRSVTNSNAVGLAIAAVPSGTTGDVVVTFSGTVLRCGIGLWAATGLSSATPADTDSSASDDPKVFLDIPAGGFAVGVATAGGSGFSAVWSNLTEKYDAQIGAEASIHSGASDEFPTQQTGLSIQCTFGAGAQEDVGAFASWGVAAAGHPTMRRWSGIPGMQYTGRRSW